MTRDRRKGPGRYAGWLAVILPAALVGVMLSRGTMAPPAATDRTIDFALAGLVDQEGRPVAADRFAGRHVLVYFGFTQCPDACPTSLTAVRQVLARLGPAASRLVPVLVTVDPERDPPDVLRAYVSHFHPDIVGITGTADAILRLERQFAVIAEKRVVDEASGAYLIDHTSAFFVVGPQGNLQATLPATATVDELVASLQPLVRQSALMPERMAPGADLTIVYSESAVAARR